MIPCRKDIHEDWCLILTVTYFILREEPPSEYQVRMYHSTHAYRKVAGRIRVKPPRDKTGFIAWIINNVGVNNFYPARYIVCRNQAEGESAGFKKVFDGYVSWDDAIHYKHSSEKHSNPSKAIPDVPWSRQPWWQKQDTFRGFNKSQRKRF